MKKMIKATMLASVAALTMGFVTVEHQESLCSGFVPENNLKIPVGHLHPWSLRANRAGITEDQFNGVIDRFEELYRDEFSSHGGTLNVARRWDDGTVNAYANREGSTWVVNMFGGLARHPAITADGFALVICHEGGHHIGGAPKMSGSFGSAWATNEGGADYFTGLKCLRRSFAQDDNEAIIKASEVAPLARSRCESEFSSRSDQNVCMRIALAGESVAALFQDLRHQTSPADFATPDTNEVSEMFDAHPGTQCRLDTYFNAGTCHVDASVAQSETDPSVGACVQGRDSIGYRPRCWFKPENEARN